MAAKIAIDVVKAYRLTDKRYCRMTNYELLC